MSSHKHFSREGFQQIPHGRPEELGTGPNDVTIDIPLAPVTSRTGIRKSNTNSPIMSNHDFDDSQDDLNEKGQASHSFTNNLAGRRRRRLDDQARLNRDDSDGSLNSLGRIYRRIYNFSFVTRYFVFVAPLALLIAVPMVTGATMAPKARIGGVKLLWFFTWIEVVWVSLWVSKLFAKLLPFIFQFFCGVVNPGTRKYAAVITNLEIPLSLVGWAVTSLTTFAVLMTQNPDARSRDDTSLKSWQTIVKNILLAAVCSSLVFLVEKFLIQLISISYHRKQFDDKIKQSKHNIYLVSMLYSASRKLFPPYCPEFAADDYIVNDSLDFHGSRLSVNPAGHKRSGSATPMRIIHGVGRVKDNVASAFGHVAQEVTGKKVFNPNAAHSVVVQALEKKHTTEALARRIWLSFVLEGREALYRDDMYDVLGPEHQEEADEAFDTLDADGNGDISLDELTMRLIQFGRDRLSVTHSIRDVDQAIRVLDSLLLTVVFIVVILIFVAFLNSSFVTTLATTGTALLSLSFVFATTCQEVLGSCIFLFVKHPFDVGDRVDINSTEYTVERISLLYTMFKSVKNHKRTQVPNIVLNTLWIDNVSRSKAMRETISLFVSFDTTMKDLDLLRDEMARFVQDNPRDFQPGIDVELIAIAEMDKLELKVEIKHKSNWANEAVRATRRSKFMCALVLALRKIPLYGPSAGTAPAGDKANPNYYVTITPAEAEANAKEFDKEKEKKRIDFDPAKTSFSTATSTAVSLPHRSQSGQRENDKDDKNSHGPGSPHSTRHDDIEQVRGMLRRETTTGRRRRQQRAENLDTQANYPYLGSRTIPTIPAVSPEEPVQPSQRQPARTNYFEDTSFTTAPAAPELPSARAPQPDYISSDHPPGGSVGSIAFPAPPSSTKVTTAPREDLQVRTSSLEIQDLPEDPITRVDSATIPDSAQVHTMASPPPPAPTATNPFHQKALPAQPPKENVIGRARSLSEQKRNPIPGISEMKEYLTSPKSPPRI